MSGTELLLCIPRTSAEMVWKTLDAGVRNLFVSHVDSAADAEVLARGARFDYDGDPGERHLASPRASRWGLAENYAATEDRETVVGATIESRAAVGEIDDICAVPERGFVCLGPLDLSVAHGHPGEPDHESVQTDGEQVLDVALEADVAVRGWRSGSRTPERRPTGATTS